MDEGEKVTSYFCNLKNRNFLSKCMSHLFNKSGKTLSEQQDIIHETKLFYENLYSFKETEDVNLKQVFANYTTFTLDNMAREVLEGPLSYSEILLVLKNLKNDKSPGYDRFTSNFYKFSGKTLAIS